MIIWYLHKTIHSIRADIYLKMFHFRFHAKSLARMRQLLIIVSIVTIFTTLSWTIITFFGESVWEVPDPETYNQTMTVQVPRLMLHSWYPWDASQGLGYLVAFILQVKLERITKFVIVFISNDILQTFVLFKL